MLGTTAISIILCLLSSVAVGLIVGIVAHRIGWDSGVSSGYKLGHGLREQKPKECDDYNDVKQINCDVCGGNFKLNKKNSYIVREEIGTIFTSRELTMYDAIDCPYCGCQKILSPRKRPLYERKEENKEIEVMDLSKD